MVDISFFGNHRALKGTITVPGDKSISHRSLIFGAIANGTTVIKGLLRGNDCLCTLACFKQLGVDIQDDGDTITIHGNGFDGLKESERILDVGNSGTTIRLLMGLLSARSFYSVFIGDDSIHRRPMDRIIKPLEQMGGRLHGRKNNRYVPITVVGQPLHPTEYTLPVASAQIKSAIILAAMQTNGVTKLTEPAKSRDHTERMLKAFGGHIEVEGTTYAVKGPQNLTGTAIQVPGDISSAAFFIVGGLITPGSELTIQSVGVNPTRIGLLKVLEDMGADITLSNEREWNNEPVADITVRYSKLKGTTISGDLIPQLIDEIPIIALLATQADGETVIKDAEELKVKETNRIDTTVGELSKLGADIRGTDDGMIIHGHPSKPLKGGHVHSYGDHRIGMTLAIAGQLSTEPVIVEEAEAISVSFPSFETLLKQSQS
ncbi:3-phosphoshikimate 1-carboxyvinyltransferase [Terrilactibacillus laevilacticus]|uniref:3-phosphoshikimate 1-carboxyvinyltransferase n=1 Tax=Terrilactibacillus laevilacticus TaxID=1380157 RepID=UPI001146E024|nr:3-phosphoshikimate 1-carboxyvinyltransferase [Terrilactibacillus laevilacticus]